MAVDASHLNLLPPQLIHPNRDFGFSNQGNILAAYNNAQIGLNQGIPLVPAMAEGLFPPLHQSLVCDSVQPKTSINTDSGLTYNVPAAAAPRKRQRDSFDHFSNVPANFFPPSQKNNNDVSHFPSSFGDNILPYIQQYQMDIDAIISQHTKKIRLELEERQKQHARILMSAIGEGVMKRLKEKDEQIQRMGKLNLALQERVKSLYVENQLWRDLAQTNEATANSLRTNLEQVLAHVSDERLSAAFVGGGAPAEDDAESYCGSSDHGNAIEIVEERQSLEQRRIFPGQAQDGLVADAQDKGEANVAAGNNGGNRSRMCKVCGERESCVLLLPCRHLCLCTHCGSTLLRTCPVCNSNMEATVHVNLPS